MADGLSSRSNLWRSRAFRNEVLLFLHRSGFPDVREPKPIKSMSEAIGGDLEHGDIVGLPWTLVTRNQQTLDLSGTLDKASLAARRAGTDLYAAIHCRKNHTTAESYVTMPLSVFAAVLQLDQSG